MDQVFQIEPHEAFQNVLQKILTNLYYSGSTLPTSSLEADVTTLAKQELISLISDSNFDLQKVKDIIASKGWSPEKTTSFHELLEVNKSEVLFAALNNHNSSYCDTVVNFDWLLKLIFGTNEMKTLKYPLLQLVMTTLNKNGKQDKIMYDTNKDIILKLINALENVIKKCE